MFKMFAKKVRENPLFALLENQDVVMKACGYEVLSAMLVDCLGVIVVTVPQSDTGHFHMTSMELWQPTHSEVHAVTSDKEATKYCHTYSKDQVTHIDNLISISLVYYEFITVLFMQQVSSMNVGGPVGKAGLATMKHGRDDIGEVFWSLGESKCALRILGLPPPPHPPPPSLPLIPNICCHLI